MAEFVDSFQTLSQAGPAVMIFGSARTKRNDKYYRAASDITKGLAIHSFWPETADFENSLDG